MKATKVSVLVSKKLGKNYNSWSVSYGVTAELQGEDYEQSLLMLDKKLRKLLKDELPSDGQKKGSLIALK